MQSAQAGSHEVRWFVLFDGTANGPYKQSDLLQWLKTGRLSKLADICPEGGKEWRPAKDWDELFPRPTRQSQKSDKAASNQQPWYVSTYKLIRSSRASEIVTFAVSGAVVLVLAMLFKSEKVPNRTVITSKHDSARLFTTDVPQANVPQRATTNEQYFLAMKAVRQQEEAISAKIRDEFTFAGQGLGNDHEIMLRQANEFRTIDLTRCPAEFQNAYQEYCRELAKTAVIINPRNGNVASVGMILYGLAGTPHERKLNEIMNAYDPARTTQVDAATVESKPAAKKLTGAAYAYRFAIYEVIKQHNVAEHSGGTITESMKSIRAIDVSRCPVDFQNVYKRHVQALVNMEKGIPGTMTASEQSRLLAELTAQRNELNRLADAYDPGQEFRQYEHAHFE